MIVKQVCEDCGWEFDKSADSSRTLCIYCFTNKNPSCKWRGGKGVDDK